MKNKKIINSFLVLTSSVVLVACGDEVKNDIDLKDDYKSDLTIEEKEKFDKAQAENEKSKERYSIIYDEEFRNALIEMFENIETGSYKYFELINYHEEKNDEGVIKKIYIFPNVENKHLYEKNNIDAIVKSIEETNKQTNFIVNYNKSRLIQEDLEVFETIRMLALQYNNFNDDIYQLYLNNKDINHGASYFYELTDTFQIIISLSEKTDKDFGKYLERENGINLYDYLNSEISMEELKEQAKESGYEVKDNIYKKNNSKAKEDDGKSEKTEEEKDSQVKKDKETTSETNEETKEIEENNTDDESKE